MVRTLVSFAALSLALLTACGDSQESPADADNPGAEGAPPPDRSEPSAPSDDRQPPAPGGREGGGGNNGGAAPGTDTPQQSEPEPQPRGPVQCGIQLPLGAAVPPPLPTYVGSCPALAAYPAYTEISSRGTKRRFLVVRPSTLAENETLPVVFSWHWLGGDPEAMVDQLGLVEATERLRFVAIVPAAKNTETFRWPFTNAMASDGRMDEEYSFFDDMLSCVAAALPIDAGCVSSMGVSAGALFTDQLVIGRSERLASFASLSGGVGGLARPWSSPQHKLPGLVLWGGDDDDYPDRLPVMQFDKLSANLAEGMVQDGLGMVECVHNCGHTVPPFDTPAGGLRFEAVFDFLLRHPYGLADGELNYPDGLPASFPAWCSVGRGSAVPRTGVCP